MAMLKIVLFVQSSSFSKELHLLRNNKAISTKSQLLPLNPFIDENDALRVGGRLQKSLLPFDAKHPWILPADHKISSLLIRQYHLIHLHAGQTLLTNILRQRFWIINCKKLVKKIINNYITCTRYRQAKTTQIMGDLPEARVTPALPFSNTGIDYAGPFALKFNKGRGSKTTKGYVAIFVCLATKAVHLEAASDLSADNFIAALRRFSSRRGAPRHIFCDNGRNFVGAERKLNDIQKFLLSVNENEDIAFFLSQSNIEFHFNPPASPHFGGLWEMKFHLKRVIGETVLTFEEITNLLTPIEACLNSRPLVATSDSSLEVQVLTPSHFLIGDVLLSSLDDIPVNNLSYSSRWNLVQSMRNGIWKSWKRDYLSTLQSRVKWRMPQPNVREGNIVLLKDSGPAGSWTMGRVVAVHPGADFKTRVVDIKTNCGLFRRSISKLVLLPVDCQE
ncbi:uncharacterized protein LOC129223035 [Uloborus diversus]|uniref:uncharacterized protein LOC129223035 n=1 Tax=Uloborus diversus TaxID=327109 RepID=UPI002408F827|nr:uncharacterized protein LOC129223035 [Uloborus diversus]